MKNTTTTEKSSETQLFSAWELETIFHVFSNKVYAEGGRNTKQGAKYQKILEKAINERARICPNYHDDPSLWGVN